MKHNKEHQQEGEGEKGKSLEKVFSFLQYLSS